MDGESAKTSESDDEIEIKSNKDRSDDDLSSQKEIQNYDKEEEFDKLNTHKESKTDENDDNIILISSSDVGSPPCENLLNQLNLDPILDSSIRGNQNINSSKLFI